MRFPNGEAGEGRCFGRPLAGAAIAQGEKTWEASADGSSSCKLAAERKDLGAPKATIGPITKVG
jgi:hypothetical protein